MTWFYTTLITYWLSISTQQRFDKILLFLHSVPEQLKLFLHFNEHFLHYSFVLFKLLHLNKLVERLFLFGYVFFDHVEPILINAFSGSSPLLLLFLKSFNFESLQHLVLFNLISNFRLPEGYLVITNACLSFVVICKHPQRFSHFRIDSSFLNIVIHRILVQLTCLFVSILSSLKIFCVFKLLCFYSYSVSSISET